MGATFQGVMHPWSAALNACVASVSAAVSQSTVAKWMKPISVATSASGSTTAAFQVWGEATCTVKASGVVATAYPEMQAFTVGQCLNSAAVLPSGALSMIVTYTPSSASLSKVAASAVVAALALLAM